MTPPDLSPLRPLLAHAPREREGKWYFREVRRETEVTDALDRFKSRLKLSPRLYNALITLVSPVLSSPAPIHRFLAATPGVVLNIGSGNTRIAPGVVNVDMFDYPNVDLVADIHHLPFADASVDGVLSIAVLEHVQDPEAVLREVRRVLKPGGRVFSLIPFMQPFHASPHDFQRYTLPGIRRLHREFTEVESGVAGGPASGFLWAFQEMFATLFSFGNQRLHHLLLILCMVFTWPFKFLDLLLSRLPTADNLASSFFVHGKK